MSGYDIIPGRTLPPKTKTMVLPEKVIQARWRCKQCGHSDRNILAPGDEDKDLKCRNCYKWTAPAARSMRKSRREQRSSGKSPVVKPEKDKPTMGESDRDKHVRKGVSRHGPPILPPEAEIPRKSACMGPSYKDGYCFSHHASGHSQRDDCTEQSSPFKARANIPDSVATKLVQNPMPLFARSVPEPTNVEEVIAVMQHFRNWLNDFQKFTLARDRVQSEALAFLKEAIEYGPETTNVFGHVCALNVKSNNLAEAFAWGVDRALRKYFMEQFLPRLRYEFIHFEKEFAEMGINNFVTMHKKDLMANLDKLYQIRASSPDRETAQHKIPMAHCVNAAELRRLMEVNVGWYCYHVPVFVSESQDVGDSLLEDYFVPTPFEKRYLMHLTLLPQRPSTAEWLRFPRLVDIKLFLENAQSTQPRHDGAIKYHKMKLDQVRGPS